MPKNILVVEDEPDILKILLLRLNKMGYEAQVAEDGEQALGLLQRIRPDLILMDYRLPCLDGLEVCRRIKAQEGLKSVPVIIMTASSANLSREHIHAAGGQDLLKKPFEFLDLIEKINRWCPPTNRRTADEND